MSGGRGVSVGVATFAPRARRPLPRRPFLRRECLAGRDPGGAAFRGQRAVRRGLPARTRPGHTGPRHDPDPRHAAELAPAGDRAVRPGRVPGDGPPCCGVLLRAARPRRRACSTRPHGASCAAGARSTRAGCARATCILTPVAIKADTGHLRAGVVRGGDLGLGLVAAVPIGGFGGRAQRLGVPFSFGRESAARQAGFQPGSVPRVGSASSRFWSWASTPARRSAVCGVNVVLARRWTSVCPVGTRLR